MAVGYLASSESHTGTSGSTGGASFSWSHDPGGTPRGVLVFVFTHETIQNIDAVTYGGAALTKIGQASHTSGESGFCAAYFLGANVPLGTQTVLVDRGIFNAEMYAVCVTAGANADTETAGLVTLVGNSAVLLADVDDGHTAGQPASVRFAGLFSGLTSPPAATSGSAVVQSIDYGAQSAAVARETVAGVGSRTVGFSSGTSDDRAFLAVAIRELPGSGPTGDTLLVGGGSLTTTAAKTGYGLPVVAGGGALAASASKTARGLTALIGGGLITVTGAAGTLAKFGDTLLTGGGALIAVGGKGVRAVTAVFGGGALVDTGRKGGRGQTALPGGGALSAVTRKGALTATTVVGGGLLQSIAYKGGFAVSAVTGGGSLTASARKAALAATNVVGGGALTAIGQAVGAVHTVLAGGGALIATGRKGARELATTAGGGALTAVGRAARYGLTALAGGGGVTTEGTSESVLRVPARIVVTVRRGLSEIKAAVRPPILGRLIVRARSNAGMIRVTRTAAMNYVNQPVTLDVEVFGTNGALANSADMYAAIMEPDSSGKTRHACTGSGWTNPETGKYTYTFTPTRPGVWRIEFTSYTPPSTSTVAVEVSSLG